jgi:hypothetical protein
MSRKVRVLGAAAFAAITAALASAGAATMVIGDVGFSWVLGRRSADLLTGSPSAGARAEAERLDRAALRQSPYDNSARLRLVYAEMTPTGQLGALGAARIGESYELLPIDYPVAAWRIQFSLEHWDELPPETRAAVRHEVLIFSKLPTRNVDVSKLLSSVKNPAGAAAAAEMLEEIRR